MTEQTNKNFGRRQFLARAGKAGVSIAAAAGASYLLYDSTGPKEGADGEELVTLAYFSVQHRQKIDETRRC